MSIHSPEIELQEMQEETGNEEENSKRRVVKETKPKAEDSYSETQQAFDIEARSGDLSALKKSKKFQNLKGPAKTLIAYQAISGQLGKLIESYTQLVENDMRRAQKMLADIKKIRAMQKLLLTRLFGELEDNDEIDNQALEKELQEFLE